MTAKVEWLDPNPSISDSDLVWFEMRHRIALPPAYREFLLANNGGQPNRKRFPICGMPNNPFGVIQALFGINATIPTEDIGRVFADLPSTVPSGIVPIGCTEGDDFLCFDLRNRTSRIVYWDRKPFWGNEVWDEDQLYPVAEEFSSFLCLLR